MALYRAKPKDGIAWVTGASTGIGRALALDLAREGYRVAVTARTEEKLVSLAEEANNLPGRILPFPCDVTDEKAMARIVDTIERGAGPIVLAVFNAGMYHPTRGEKLTAENFVRTYATNLFGVIHGLIPTVERMRERGYGHVAIVASISSYFGWPSTAAYGASKAALNNMAESLKFDFDRMNIRIQVINPGFIDTPLTEKNVYVMPALMQVDEAAKRMLKGLKSGGFEVTFPHRFTWFLKLLRACPQPMRFWLVSKATGSGKRPVQAARKPKN